MCFAQNRCLKSIKIGFIIFFEIDCDELNEMKSRYHYFIVDQAVYIYLHLSFKASVLIFFDHTLHIYSWLTSWYIYEN